MHVPLIGRHHHSNGVNMQVLKLLNGSMAATCVHGYLAPADATSHGLEHLHNDTLHAILCVSILQTACWCSNTVQCWSANVITTYRLFNSQTGRSEFMRSSRSHLGDHCNVLICQSAAMLLQMLQPAASLATIFPSSTSQSLHACMQDHSLRSHEPLQQPQSSSAPA